MSRALEKGLVPNVPLVELTHDMPAPSLAETAGDTSQGPVPHIRLHELFVGASLLVIDFHLPSLTPARTAFPTVAVDA